MGQTSSSAIQQQIIQAAQEYDVPPALALAVAQQESSFNPNATATNKNGSTDYGVFQINSSNLSSLGLNPTSVMDPSTNIDAGVSMLSSLLAQYGGNTTLALEAYNAGPNAVASGNIPSSTQSYVAAVLANQGQYSSIVPSSYVSTDGDSGSDDGSDSGDTVDVSVAGVTMSNSTLAIAAAAGLFVLWKLFGD